MKDLDRVAAGLAARQHGAFRRRQVLSVTGSPGACDRRLASGQWLRTRHPRVYVLAGYPPSWLQRVMAAVLAGPAGAVASHRAAAILHGIREGASVEVTVPRGSQSRLGVMVHQTGVAPVERTVVNAIPVTRVERTLVDLAAVMGDDALERAVEAALRHGLTTVERLRAQLLCGRWGVARLRRVLDRRARGRPAGSELEARLIQLLRAAGLPDPVRQYEVRIGGERYFLDLTYPERRLCIELDGRDAHEGAAFQRDRTRQNALVLAGWAVLRFTWADVAERGEQVVSLVAQALAS